MGVLKGLRALHDMRLVHGVLHPNNVFLDDNNSACLAEFDFTKTLVRSRFSFFRAITVLFFSTITIVLDWYFLSHGDNVLLLILGRWSDLFCQSYYTDFCSSITCRQLPEYPTYLEWEWK